MDKRYIVNTLPSPTWHHLGVNSALFPANDTTGKKVDLDELFSGVGTAGGDEIKNSVCKNATEYNEITLAPGEEKNVFLPHEPKDAEVVRDLTVIRAGAGSKLTLVQTYISDADAYHAGETLVFADERAEVTIAQVQLLGASSSHISDLGIRQEKDSRVSLIQAELSSKAAFASAKSALVGDRSFFKADTIYFGDGERRVDMNYIAQHFGKNSECEMTASGALLDSADKVYRGTIDFKRGCGGSVGHETENTLLFSPDARNRTVPLILCEEEDVEGNHAATIGKIDAGKLFYMQTRGISEKEAKRLAIEAQFAPVIAAIPNEEVKGRIRHYLDGRMKID